MLRRAIVGVGRGFRETGQAIERMGARAQVPLSPRSPFSLNGAAAPERVSADCADPFMALVVPAPALRLHRLPRTDPRLSAHSASAFAVLLVAGQLDLPGEALQAPRSNEPLRPAAKVGRGRVRRAERVGHRQRRD